MVKFATWSRVINGVQKESILDHVYTSDVTNIVDLYSVNPDIGDHKIIIIDFRGSLPTLVKL